MKRGTKRGKDRRTQGLFDGKGVSNSGGRGFGGMCGTIDLALNTLEVLDVHCSVARAA